MKVTGMKMIAARALNGVLNLDLGLSLGLRLGLGLGLAITMFAVTKPAQAETPATSTPPQMASGCLDLAGFLGQIRALPDRQFMHHELMDLKILSQSDDTPPTDLANQHALDLFYHPNLAVLGLAAGKSGGSYLHDFTAYQLDCAKVVTGDIFAAEGMSIIWQVTDHDANSLTLKRLTKGGAAEITADLTLVLRKFQVIAPAVFSVTSAYSFDTKHACVGSELTENNTLIATEVFAVDSASQNPKDLASDGLKTLLAKYPRVSAPAGHRGDFANPVTPKNDPACGAASAVR